MFKIIIAEDDHPLRNLFAHVLGKNGYSVKEVGNGKEALDALKNDCFDLIISDIMMPVMDGFEMVRRLREEGNGTPVLMITAKDAFDDIRRGFLSGTDDYMIKPVNIHEMVLRVQALLRRSRMISERKLTLGGTVLERDSFSVCSREGVEVLPQKEFMLLYQMAGSLGKIFTRQQLTDGVWGNGTRSDTHVVDVYIGKLRERFKNSEDFKIVTIRGVGYKVIKRDSPPSLAGSEDTVPFNGNNGGNS